MQIVITRLALKGEREGERRMYEDLLFSHLQLKTFKEC
jgi:hypothetical protein